MTSRAHAPLTEEELLARARELVGHSLAEIASRHSILPPGKGLHAKGKSGEFLERVLGATGTHEEVDFPGLDVELKSVPLRPDGAPWESTFVCAIRVEDADQEDWSTSWVRRKLRRVLFVPIVFASRRAPPADRVIGEPVMWSPAGEVELQLRDDFEEIIGRLGVGDFEEVTAHRGKLLQLRPKGKDRSETTAVLNRDGERIDVMRRGFYLRPSFVGAILRGEPS